MGGVWEMWYHCLGKKLSNNEKMKYTMALNGCRLMNFHTTTNQKRADAVKERRQRRCNHWGAWEGCKSIILVAIEWGVC